MSMLFAFLMLLLIDTFFVCGLALLLGPVGYTNKPAFAVLMRNFVGYFSNPTGYVFLCVFVVLTCSAAFLPQEFFNNNLANLDQLNQYLPLVMLVFIPAITMGAWADERRQGTDELLLTLPATDFDIVMGKYLAAAMIFTISLIFSQICSFAVLIFLTNGVLDLGLLCTTYLGYWLMGLAMISIGMVASFLTNNLTIAFILGVAMNAPLALMSYAHLLISRDSVAQAIEQWGLLEQFSDFGRGVISLSSTVFFVMLMVIGQYVCMVLIGRRHWLGGSDGESMLGHYVVRTICLILAAAGLTYLLSNADPVRLDMTEGRVNSLAPDTRLVLGELENDKPVYIDAYISENIPEAYAETRFQLETLLKEFEAMAGGKIHVRIHKDLDPFGPIADQAEERYGIRARNIVTQQRGVLRNEDVILGAAFTCGLEKVVAPFFDSGIPVEYELVRSITTVAKGEQQTIGVVQTNWKLMGGEVVLPTAQGPQLARLGKEAFIRELEKQYRVETVDPSEPIERGKYKVLFVAQPSSLSDSQLTNVMRAIRDGQPTAIFEDPLPVSIQAPGTGDERLLDPILLRLGRMPEPKCDMKRLWDMLGIHVSTARDENQAQRYKAVWQDYNPYPKLKMNGVQAVVFVRDEARADKVAFNPGDPITAEIEELWFLCPGAIQPRPSDLKVTPLVRTGDNSGELLTSEYRQFGSNPAMLKAKKGLPVAGREFVLAARIQGVPPVEKSPLFPDAEPASDGKQPEIDVVYVADIDLMMADFVRSSEETDQRIDNVNFLLNIVDVLAGDQRFVNIRSRKLQLSTLQRIEDLTAQAQQREQRATQEAEQRLALDYKKIEEETNREVEAARERVRELTRKASKGDNVDLGALQLAREKEAVAEFKSNREKEFKRESNEKELNETNRRNERRTNLEIRNVERWIKIMSVALPPLIPLAIGFGVFVTRRLREREGVSKARLRW
ncbi:Gldg family protein [Lignipirellula cremea]|uniref:ABC-type uncharacterized transport system n=1 Tax=Lignipirellula cremea TaxID=2528010 RepID=A0A518E3S7_9BACT|nr:Gldg family protein [Lignipirellula cremea]QDU98744.1 ABC-type uncharacterized transport system [Lignipirellula cremea]